MAVSERALGAPGGRRRRRRAAALPAFLVALLAALLLALGAGPALAYEVYGFAPDFPPAHIFEQPAGMAAGPDGRLYVADTNRHRVQVFGPDGGYIREFGWGSAGSEPGRFNQPWAVAVAPDGTVYVADAGNHRVQAFDAEGNFLRLWGGENCSSSLPRPDGAFCWPKGIAVGADGNVYVADSGNHRIQVFSPDGTLLGKWGKNGGDGSGGSADGEFYTPVGIAVVPTGAGGAEEVYVADRDNHRIQVFRPDGTFLRKWGGWDCSGPRDDGKFCAPQGLAAAPTGGGGAWEVYVADTSNHRVQVFAPAGGFLRKWGKNGGDGSWGKGFGEFYVPQGVAAVAGAVFVADTGNDRVQKFSPAGGYLDWWGAGLGDGPGKFNSDEGVGFDGAGNVYVTDRFNHRIQAFDPDGAFLWARGSYGSGDGQMINPDGLYTDVAGFTYVADTGNHRIDVFDAAGNFVTKFGGYGSGDGQFNYPHDVTIDGAGRLYVTDFYNHRVQVFVYQAGGGWTFWKKFGGYGSGPGQFYNADHVDVGPDGHVYVTDRNNHRVQEFAFDPGAGQYVFVRQIGAYGTDPGKFVYPRSVRLDAQGNIYVTEVGSTRRVQKLAPDGVTVLALWGGAGDSPGRFGGSGPYGLAVTEDGGEVYVTDPGNHRVQRFRRNEGDTVPPEVTHTVNCPWGWNSWCTGDAQVTLTATEAGSSVSQVAYVRYRVDDGGWQSYYAPFMFGVEGEHLIRYFAVDTAGNRSSDRLFWLRVDKTPPAVSGVLLNGGADETTSLNVELAVYAADSGGGGLYRLRIRNEWSSGYQELPFTGSLPWEMVGGSQDGPRNVYVQAVDGAGNASPWTGDSIQYRSPYLFQARWGNAGPAPGQFNYPQGLDTDAQGNVYVADSYNHRVQVFRPDGTFLRQWGSYGSGDGQFSYPRHLAVDAVGGYVYVAETGNHRIQVFDTAGNFIRKFGSYGSGNGQLSSPEDLALDGAGNVYVADWGNHRVQVFGPDGTFLRKWGGWDCSGPRDDGKFCYPQGLAIDRLRGIVYVADRHNHRVQAFDLNGSFLGKWGKNGGAYGEAGSGDGEFNNPVEIDVDADGNVYVADFENHVIQKFSFDPGDPNSAGDETVTFLAIWGGLNDFNGGSCAGSGFTGFLCNPAGVEVDDQGRVLVSDHYAHRVQRFIPSSWVDTAPPATEAALAGTAGLNGWWRSAVEVTLTAADPGPAASGVAWVQYRVDGAAWQTCPGGGGPVTCGPFTVSGDGWHLVEYQAADEAGHVEPLQSVKVQIDTTPPAGSVLVNEGASSTHNLYVRLGLTASDGVSGVERMLIDNVPGFVYSADLPFAPWQDWMLAGPANQNGTRTVYVKFRDGAGNESVVATDTIWYHADPHPLPPPLCGGQPCQGNWPADPPAWWPPNWPWPPWPWP